MSIAAPALDLVARIRPGERPFGDPAFRAVFEYAERTDGAGRDALIRDLLPGLANPNSYRASCIAISCGSIIEYGADPATAGLAIVDRLRAAARVEPIDRDAMGMFDQAAMAHLCRSVSVRVAARAAGADEIEGAPWTSIALTLVDDLDLLVLAPIEAVGWRVRIEAIKTCAHLFTLLQAAVIPPLPGDPVDPAVIAIASGAEPMRTIVIDRQRFRFDDWTSLTGPRELARGLGGFLPADMSPANIRPLPDGRRVILLGPPQLGGRSWDSNFFANIHDALRSRVEIIETLSSDQVAAEVTAILACRLSS